MKKKRVLTSFYLFVISILFSFLVASVIYLVNTYWYQASKATKAEQTSNGIYQNLRNVQQTNQAKYLEKFNNIVMKSNEKILIELYDSQNNPFATIQNKTMSEFPNSNYFLEKKQTEIFIHGQSYTMNYMYKKRVGNTLLKDLFVASTFSFSANKKAWWEKRLYKKSFVFYSYFLFILIVNLLFSYIYNREISKVRMEEIELGSLLEQYKANEYDQEIKRDNHYNEVVLQIEKEYREKIEKVRNKYRDKSKKNITKSYESLEPTIDKVDSINGKEHITELINTLVDAKESVYILSGWVSSYVITPEMIKVINNALDRGVDIYIGFGHGSIAGVCENLSGMQKPQQDGINALFKILKQNKSTGQKGTLLIGYFPTHQKILIKDDYFIICGSNNWLSNGIFKNYETSFKVYSKQLIVSEKIRIKDLVEKHEVSHCDG